MSKTDQLKEDIEVLLEHSVFNTGMVYHAKNTNTNETPEGVFKSITEAPDNYGIIHDQAVSLAKLYRQSNLSNQKEINSLITQGLTSGGEMAKTSARFFFLTGQVSYLLDYLLANLKKYSDKSLTNVLREVNHFFLLQWDQLSITHVKQIRTWAANYLEGKSELGQEANKYDTLYEEITLLARGLYRQCSEFLAKDAKVRIEAGYNPEVNVDKETLKIEITRFGFPADLTQTLDKIEGKFSNAKDAFDFKGCIDLIRAFTERLYRSILDSYGEEGQPIDEKDSEKVADFLIKKGLVSDHFGSMLAQFRHFLSDQAAHRLKSREEDARLTKNMVIEMSLYLLRRYENH